MRRAAEAGVWPAGTSEDQQVVQLTEGARAAAEKTVVGGTRRDTENQPGIFALSAVRSRRMK